MPVRSLPARPHLDQLERQAKELLHIQPELGRLRDAQRAIAHEYGFPSWDALRSHVESISGVMRRSIIKPAELESVDGGVIWSAITASGAGDFVTLRELIKRDPGLSRAESWYTPAIHFAVPPARTAPRKIICRPPSPNSPPVGISQVMCARDSSGAT